MGIELAPTDANLRLNLITALRNRQKNLRKSAAEYEVTAVEQDFQTIIGIYRELGEIVPCN